MRAFLAGIFCLAAVICGSSISANAAVIASCGPMEGYSYFIHDELAGNEAEWVRDSLESTTIFMGTDKIEDVVIKSRLGEEDWTRSASDYDADVMELPREGSIRRVLIYWGPVIELYAVDMAKKSLSLVSQKSRPIKVMHAYAGKCE